MDTTILFNLQVEHVLEQRFYPIKMFGLIVDRDS